MLICIVSSGNLFLRLVKFELVILYYSQTPFLYNCCAYVKSYLSYQTPLSLSSSTTTNSFPSSGEEGSCACYNYLTNGLLPLDKGRCQKEGLFDGVFDYNANRSITILLHLFGDAETSSA